MEPGPARLGPRSRLTWLVLMTPPTRSAAQLPEYGPTDPAEAPAPQALAEGGAALMASGLTRLVENVGSLAPRPALGVRPAVDASNGPDRTGPAWTDWAARGFDGSAEAVPVNPEAAGAVLVGPAVVGPKSAGEAGTDPMALGAFEPGL